MRLAPWRAVTEVKNSEDVPLPWKVPELSWPHAPLATATAHGGCCKRAQIQLPALSLEQHRLSELQSRGMWCALCRILCMQDWPLIFAPRTPSQEVVSLLLKHGVTADEQDDNGDSALLCACRQICVHNGPIGLCSDTLDALYRMGHADIVRLLLACGADPGRSNFQGNNALDVALEARNLLGRPEARNRSRRRRRPVPPPKMPDTQQVSELLIRHHRNKPTLSNASLSVCQSEARKAQCAALLQEGGAAHECGRKRVKNTTYAHTHA